MGSKRKSSDDNGDGEESPTRAGGSKRPREGEETEDELMKKLFLFIDSCTEEEVDEFMKKLDIYVQKLRQKYRFNVPHSSSRKRKYRLRFRNELPNILFTETNFIVDDIVIEIDLVDASNNVITTGPMATAEIEIVVLNGDLNGDENGELTEEEFMNYVLEPREGKGSLLIGNLSMRLCDGIGSISDAQFTDNSSWANKFKSFRLGVRGMAKEVQEGISNAFRVKDRRGKCYQKDRILSMNDEVCCLKGISKNGTPRKKLVECNIKTVQDFLCYCDKNGLEKLRDMIGMSKRKWAKTYGHASKSREWSDGRPVNPPAPDQNFYELTGSSSAQPSNVLVRPNGSGISTSAQGLPAPISFEPGKATFIICAGNCSGTNRLDMSFEDLPKENGRSSVPNNSDIASPLLREKWLMLLFVARLKMAAPRSRESKCSETSSPRCNWFKLLFITSLKVTVLRLRKRKHYETSSLREDDFDFLVESLFENLSPILYLTP